MPLDPPRSPPTEKAPPGPRRSDASCFAAYANKERAEKIECHDCGRDADSGEILDVGGPTTMGRPILLARFFCKMHLGNRPTSVTVARFFPAWSLVSRLRPGVYWIKHLTESEKAKRVE